MKIFQQNKGYKHFRKSAKINPPSKSQASFRSKTTDRDVSDVLNLMKAMISEYLLLFSDNFEISIVQSPKIKIFALKKLF